MRQTAVRNLRSGQLPDFFALSESRLRSAPALCGSESADDHSPKRKYLQADCRNGV